MCVAVVSTWIVDECFAGSPNSKTTHMIAVLSAMAKRHEPRFFSLVGSLLERLSVYLTVRIVGVSTRVTWTPAWAAKMLEIWYCG